MVKRMMRGDFMLSNFITRGLSLKARSRAEYVKMGLRTSKENVKVKRRRLWVLRMKSRKVVTKKAM